MKKLVAILSFVLILGSISFATNDEAPIVKTNVSGSVIDKQTGEALAGVKVVLSELNEIVYTDFDGNFEFKKVTQGKYTIKAELISYDDKSIAVDMSEDPDIKIEIEN